MHYRFKRAPEGCAATTVQDDRVGLECRSTAHPELDPRGIGTAIALATDRRYYFVLHKHIKLVKFH